MDVRQNGSRMSSCGREGMKKSVVKAVRLYGWVSGYGL